MIRTTRMHLRRAAPLAICAIMLCLPFHVAHAQWPPTLADFDPDATSEFDDFFNPLNFDPPTPFSPIQLSTQSGIGTGGTNGIQFTPGGNSSGEQEFSVYAPGIDPVGGTPPTIAGSLAGASDTLRQSLDFRFTDLGSQALVGFGLGQDDTILLLEAGSDGAGNILISTLNQTGSITPIISLVGSIAPVSPLNWLRLDLTITSSGDDVTLTGGLFDIGPNGTDSPSSLFPVSETLTNAGVANGTELLPGYRVFSAQGNQTTDTTYVDNFRLIPEPSSAMLALLAVVGWIATLRRQRRRPA